MRPVSLKVPSRDSTGAAASTVRHWASAAPRQGRAIAATARPPSGARRSSQKASARSREAGRAEDEAERHGWQARQGEEEGDADGEADRHPERPAIGVGE